MRKLLFLILGLFALTHASGQKKTYEPLLEDGKMWVYEHHYVDINFNFLTCESRDWIEGDTVIDGRSIYKMYSIDYYEEDARPTVSYWYEEEGKVYNYVQGKSFLVYDFTLSQGEILPPGLPGYIGIPECQVEEVDTICVRGHYRRRLSLSYPYEGRCWVEGVGTPGRVYESLGHLVSDGKRYYLQSCYLGDSLVFGKEDFDAPPYTGPGSTPLVEGNKVWRYKVSNPSSPPEYYYEWLEKYYLEGDTVVGGHECLRLYHDSDCPFQMYGRHYSGAVYEEGMRVYVFYPGSTEPTVLYDFTGEQDDTLLLTNTPFVVLGRTDIDYDGTPRVVLDVAPSPAMDIHAIWIKGIGCPRGSVMNISYWAPGSYRYELESCEVDGVVIYEKSRFEQIYKSTLLVPHLTESGESPSTYHQGRLYDLTGRRIASPPAHGVYIQNGRKYVR